ncbi:MAG: hypothetical protein AB8H86_16935 [Polyangiales bacterium]
MRRLRPIHGEGQTTPLLRERDVRWRGDSFFDEAPSASMRDVVRVNYVLPASASAGV